MIYNVFWWDVKPCSIISIKVQQLRPQVTVCQKTVQKTEKCLLGLQDANTK